MNTKSNRSNAFTLVELLVVIAIILVLMALLMPALKSANDRAKTVKCANNQRQYGVALATYLGDNNDYYPWLQPECSGVAGGCPFCPAWNQAWCAWPQAGSCTYGNWYSALLRYMGFNISGDLNYNYGWATKNATLMSLTRCPGQPSNWQPGGAGGNCYQSYAANADIFPLTFRATGGGYFCPCGNNTCGYWYDSPYNVYTWSKRARGSDITHASGAMYMGEQPVDSSHHDAYSIAKPGIWSGYGLPAQYGLNWFNAGMVTNIFYTGNPYNVVNFSVGGPYPFDWLTPDYNANIAMFHNQGMNALFCDGHVERIGRQQLITYTVQFLDPTHTSNWITTQNAALMSLGQTTPGGIFWNDGKLFPSIDSNWGYYGARWTYNQYPGGPLSN